MSVKRVPPKGVVTLGLDVSHYDASVDFGKVKAAGYLFCSSKCTEGITYVDDRYAANRANAKSVNMLFGAYHFFRPNIDPVQQAAFFLKNADIKSGDMIPMFDWERFLNDGSDAEKALTFLNIVEKAIGKKMLIYGPVYALNNLNLGQEFAQYALWAAQYWNDHTYARGPLLPQPWSYWSFWQYSNQGDVPGVMAQAEDVDVFNGPLDHLLKFTV